MKTGFCRNEIGSEFWDVPLGENPSNLFPRDAHWFISGTSALEYIICDIMKSRQLKSAGVPSWCCNCMIQPFIEAGISVEFYSVYVDAQGNLSCDYENVSQCDATLVLSYFGYRKLKTRGQPGGIIIRDLTHSLFSSTYTDAQYYFGSLRKWTGVWTGGYAWKKNAWYDIPDVPDADAAFLQSRQNAMTMKLDYLSGGSDKKDYLSLFEDAEDYLDQCGVQGSCARDIYCAKNLNAEFIRTRRRENAQELLSKLKDMAMFPQMEENDCPMFVPILLPDKDCRDGLRRYLISKEIYCPIHWPISDQHVLGEKERYLYDHSLSIVCDQRYDVTDMVRITDTIKEYLELINV